MKPLGPLLLLLAACAPQSSTIGARFVVHAAAAGDLDLRAQELCGPQVRYAINTRRQSSVYTIGNTEYFRAWTSAEVLCDRPNASTDPDDASQAGYCVAARGAVFQVPDLRAVQVAGEVAVDRTGALHRLPAAKGEKATRIEGVTDVTQISRLGSAYCALRRGGESAFCFTLDPGADVRKLTKIEGPLRALIADIAIKADGTAVRAGVPLQSGVQAVAAVAGRTCVAVSGGVRCRAGEGAWTPIESTSAEPIDALWLTSNVGFAVASGRIVSRFAITPHLPVPDLETGGADYTHAASSFRLGCLTRTGGEAVCWDMMGGAQIAPSRHLAGVKELRGAGQAVCGLNQAEELVCVGEQRRTARSETNLATMLRGVSVASGVVSFDLTETALSVVLRDGTVLIYRAGDC